MRPLLLAAISGVLYFVGFVGYGQHYLSWFCFVPVLLAIREATPRRALLLGTVFGTVMSFGGFYWVAGMLTNFANLGPFLSALGLTLLCLQHGLGLGLVLWAVRRLDRDRSLSPALTLPLAFTAHELLYPQIFPYYLGASQFTLPWITQIAEIFGIVGVSALVVIVNGAIGELAYARVEKRAWVRARVLVPAGIFAVAIVFGAVRTASLDDDIRGARKLKVAMIQTNLGAKDKHTNANEFTAKHVRMSAAAIAKDPSIDFLIWPETAYNRWLDKRVEDLSRTPLNLGKPMIFGALMTDEGPDGERRGFNSAVITSSTAKVLGSFDKIELLVFGEAIPMSDVFPILKKWLPMASTFSRGQTTKPLVARDGTRFLPMICYEDILPRFVRRLWREGGPVDALVNVTNDSWYGDSDEPIEHLALATFRSIETRRSLIRSTNTGISALVDPVGRITKRSGQWTEETIVGEVALIEDERSTVYQMIGDLPAWISTIALALLLARRKR